MNEAVNRKPWPRLTEPFPFHPSNIDPRWCQGCGSEKDLTRWQEHDDHDQPEPRVVVLCKACSDRIVESHPRLYRPMPKHEPFPGCMPLCVECVHRDGVTCRHPDLKRNGGTGLEMKAPKPEQMHICFQRKGGGWTGEWRTPFPGPVTFCAGRETEVKG